MSNIREVAAGTILLKEGKVTTEAFMLLHGKVAVSRKSDKKQDILLAELGEGEVFGEMSLVEASPCSATVTAVGAVRVQVLNKANFVQALQKDAHTLQTVMGSLFKRIRSMNRQVLSLQDQLSQAPNEDQVIATASASGKVVLKPLTPQAKHAIDDMESIMIDEFPYQIGRWSKEQHKKSWFSSKKPDNHINIHDIPPYMVSREHCRIEKKGKKVYLVDLESRLGTWVNGHKVGRGTKKKVELLSGKNNIYIGERESLFAFDVIVP